MQKYYYDIGATLHIQLLAYIFFLIVSVLFPVGDVMFPPLSCSGSVCTLADLLFLMVFLMVGTGAGGGDVCCVSS